MTNKKGTVEEAVEEIVEEEVEEEESFPLGLSEEMVCRNDVLE